ncbi:MAG: RidA family protein [Candidatus Latescibacteria bacterium]|nr:RidA family protein [Candidatus Latescibacterota bacterium]
MKKIIFSDKAPKPIGPYNQAVMVDNFVFISGTLGILLETGNLVEGGIGPETRQVFVNLKAVLESANLSLDNIVKTTVYMTDLSKFAEMNNIYNEYFTKDYPARATIQVAALPKGACIEIEAIALIK